MSHSASPNSKYYTKKKKKQKKKTDVDSWLKLLAFGLTWTNPAATVSSSSLAESYGVQAARRRNLQSHRPYIKHLRNKRTSDSKLESDEGQTQQASTNPESNTESDEIVNPILVFCR